MVWRRITSGGVELNESASLLYKGLNVISWKREVIAMKKRYRNMIDSLRGFRINLNKYVDKQKNTYMRVYSIEKKRIISGVKANRMEMTQLVCVWCCSMLLIVQFLAGDVTSLWVFELLQPSWMETHICQKSFLE